MQTNLMLLKQSWKYKWPWPLAILLVFCIMDEQKWPMTTSKSTSGQQKLTYWSDKLNALLDHTYYLIKKIISFLHLHSQTVDKVTMMVPLYLNLVLTSLGAFCQKSAITSSVTQRVNIPGQWGYK